MKAIIVVEVPQPTPLSEEPKVATVRTMRIERPVGRVTQTAEGLFVLDSDRADNPSSTFYPWARVFSYRRER